MYAHGYFLQDKWHPFDCKFKHFERNEISKCLTNKRFYIYGDSTGRQFMEYLLKYLTGFKTIEDENENLGPHKHYHPQHNITLFHVFHGMPFRTGKCSSFREVRYVSNELDQLEGGPDLVILLSLWAHFQKTSLFLYEQRILGILDAADRLLQRSPGTSIIFKGANTRQVGDFFWTVSSTDWVAYQFELKLRQILSRSSVNVGFIDAWDLSSAHYSEDDIHPK
ncbi:hypothetical protein BSL78_21519 [Apostichopus japonicus]|uniref:NXPE C-terminal domain-containing protein n=1 Tax=Stichopus japonicus TaxID=307972 RepID=A0A2G8K0W8_STIJA|nr:hypothetical protein BSL78_21519 [Apostichopus japonicus]